MSDTPTNPITTEAARLFNIAGEYVATVEAELLQVIQWGESFFVRAPNQQYVEAAVHVATTVVPEPVVVVEPTAPPYGALMKDVVAVVEDVVGPAPEPTPEPTPEPEPAPKTKAEIRAETRAGT